MTQRLQEKQVGESANPFQTFSLRQSDGSFAARSSFAAVRRLSRLLVMDHHLKRAAGRRLNKVAGFLITEVERHNQ